MSKTGITNEHTKKNPDEISLRPVAYSILFVGLSLFFVAMNYTTNLPYFEHFRASPLFLISMTVFFWWVKLLFALTRVNIAPLVATQLLALIANFVLRLIFLGNPKFFGFTSNIFYYLSFVSSIISIGILAIFGIKIWISNRNLRVR